VGVDCSAISGVNRATENSEVNGVSPGAYPRVLIVLMTKVKLSDQPNLLIRSIFKKWPKNHLAQIYSGETEGVGEFFGEYYRLSAEDRRWGGVFFRIKGAVVRPRDSAVQANVTSRVNVYSAGSMVKAALHRGAIASGLWEIAFPIRPSRKMLAFIEYFKPEVIYCQGYSYGFSELAQVLHRRYNLPIWFQTTDDWPHSLYKHSPMRWLVRRSARRLVDSSSLRYAFGRKMHREYQSRYRVPFQVSYHLDQGGAIPEREKRSGRHFNVVYTGSLGHRRDEAVLELVEALRMLPGLSGRCHIHVYSNNVPESIEKASRLDDVIKTYKLPQHENVQKVLREADCLFLPESQDETKECIEYSISTKAHLYMRAQVPILVYGPRYSGVVNYADEEGWATVVGERNIRMLASAIEQILNDHQKISDQLQCAKRCLATFHNEDAFEQQLLKKLVEISKTKHEHSQGSL
jgi:glycosyltransferase involved in cell wall biosynthesis